MRQSVGAEGDAALVQSGVRGENSQEERHRGRRSSERVKQREGQVETNGEVQPCGHTFQGARHVVLSSDGGRRAVFINLGSRSLGDGDHGALLVVMLLPLLLLPLRLGCAWGG